MSGLMTRRDFAGRMVLLGAGSVLFTAAPLYSSSALGEITLKWGQVPPIDTGFDEALENYPGYSAVIPVSQTYRCVDTASAPHYVLNDPQLC